jgi:hypothetical protein
MLALCNALSLLLLQIGAGDTYRMKTAAQPQVPVSAGDERSCMLRSSHCSCAAPQYPCHVRLAW